VQIKRFCAEYQNFDAQSKSFRLQSKNSAFQSRSFGHLSTSRHTQTYFDPATLPHSPLHTKKTTVQSLNCGSYNIFYLNTGSLNCSSFCNDDFSTCSCRLFPWESIVTTAVKPLTRICHIASGIPNSMRSTPSTFSIHSA
jgi:hypothetical protein